MLESAIIVPDGGSVINSVKSKLGKNGMFFLTVTTASDIPENFNYCSGLVVHRSDTMSIILFDRYYGKIAVNSLTSTVSDNKWTDWQIFVTNNDFDANNNGYIAFLKQQWTNFPVSSNVNNLEYINIEVGGPIVNALYYKHTGGAYGWAILCSYDHGLARPLYIRIIDGVWQNAYYL